MALLGTSEHWEPHYQLLGWPLRTDPACLTAEPWPDLHADAIQRGLCKDTSPVEAWQVLLQVASDGGGQPPDGQEPLGFELGDGGTLTFALPAGDPAIGPRARHRRQAVVVGS
jgi:hypothetical protein